ncbi:MAG: CARDB domain-containing protein [Dehalococcoidales bacterium]|nr:CARDB domain-containing protein [Dehalococcoidales bacterium]
MRPLKYGRAAIWRLLVIVILTLFPVFAGARPALALSVYDYFSIDYEALFSDYAIEGSDTFYATLIGTATCKKDLPLPVSSGYIKSRIVAEHRGSGDRVTLESSVKLNIEPFPNEVGGIARESIVVPLQFPAGCQPGTYDIIGELIESRAVVTTSSMTFSIPVSKYLPSSQEMDSVSYVPEEEIIVGPSIDLSDYTDSDGIFIGDFVFRSEDGRCQLSIEQDTLCLDKYGEPLLELTMIALEEQFAPPEDYGIIGLVYDLGPDGATFHPAITVILGYDDSLLSGGVGEGTLVIAERYEPGGEWVILEDSTVDPVTNTISASLSHFSAFAVLVPASLAPAPSPGTEVLTVTDLVITPQEADTGEEITISVLVTNDGEIEDTYILVLKINGAAEATGYIPLSAGSSMPVTFTTSQDTPGTYIVDVNGLTGTFEVRGTVPAAPPAEPPAAPPAEPPLSQGKTSPALVGGIIAAIAAGIAVPLVLRRRRAGR